MPIPLIPVLIGAAAGAAVTYLIMAGKSPKNLADAAQDVGATVQSNARRVGSAMTDAVDDASGAVKGVVDDATEAVKSAASKVID